jgi:phage-related protein
MYLCSSKQTNMNDNKFSVVLTEGAQAFLESLPHEAKEKIAYNIRRVMAGEMNNELFKKLENSDGIWEFRTLYKGIQYRLLAFWDTDAETLVIATHGFVKKTQKTPSKEINKAEAIRKLYFNSKK